MHIPAQRAVDAGYVENHSDTSVRTASYDLRVDKIYIKTQKNGQTKSELLKHSAAPQEMIVLVSKERIKLPSNVVAYAHPKTSFCKNGFLLLNTGIIDPGYSGKVSTVAINFRENNHQIEQGDVFLRVTFHEIQGVEKCDSDHYIYAVDDDKYIDGIVSDVAMYPKTFLDIESSVTKLSERLHNKLINKILIMLSIFAAFVTVLFFVLQLAAPSIQNLVSDKVNIESELNSIKEDMAAVKGMIIPIRSRSNDVITNVPSSGPNGAAPLEK